jgi:type III polyketide synthase
LFPYLYSVQKLLGFNTKTKIASRPSVYDHRKFTQKDATPPTLTSISHDFRTAGVDLAASACKKAMQEAGLRAQDITHIVAVTCTDSNNPGYDLFVCERLGLGPEVQRVLLQGVGCAGGLSALRAAANIASASSLKGRPARVLVVACELCSLFFRAEIQNMLQSGDETLRIAPALFSDGAAALVVCNSFGLERHQAPIFELKEWVSMVAPGTSGFMSYNFGKNGENFPCDNPQSFCIKIHIS